jgi:hypothetical protein
MTTTKALRQQTPSEIDAQIAELSYQIARLSAKSNWETDRIEHFRSMIAKGNDQRWVSDAINEGITNRNKLRDQIEKLADQIDPLEGEYRRRGGWTRAFLVTNNGGHVHRTQACSTCYITTDFVWLTDLSGKDEQGIVDLAGERACTVCYASAPVKLRLDRPTQLFSEEEKAAQKAREERAAKRQAAADASVRDADNPTKVLFKTVRGATNDIASNLSSLCWYGENHPSAPQWKREIETVRKALAAKGVEYDYDKALAAARKKTVAEQKKAKAEAFRRGYDKWDGYREIEIGAKF